MISLIKAEGKAEKEGSMELLMENKPTNDELCIVLERLIKNWETEV